LLDAGHRQQPIDRALIAGQLNRIGKSACSDRQLALLFELSIVHMFITEFSAYASSERAARIAAAHGYT
jgi:hypothetical protein